MTPCSRENTGRAVEWPRVLRRGRTKNQCCGTQQRRARWARLRRKSTREPQKPVERSKDASRRPIDLLLGCKLEYALSSTSLARSAERVCGRAGWAVRCRSVPSMVRCPCPYFCQCMRAVKQVLTTVSVGEPVVRDVRRRRRRVGVCGSDRV